MKKDPVAGPSAGEERATDDHAWANQLTEEDLPSPEERDDVAHDLELDPQ